MALVKILPLLLLAAADCGGHRAAATHVARCAKSEAPRARRDHLRRLALTILVGLACGTWRDAFRDAAALDRSILHLAHPAGADVA